MALAAAAPPWVVRAWQTDEGLPDNTVVGIGQTPDGFLWVATSTGLVRFDGVQFRPFPVTAKFLIPALAAAGQSAGPSSGIRMDAAVTILGLT